MFTIDDVRKALSGCLKGGRPGAASEFTGVTNDSRLAKPGELYGKRGLAGERAAVWLDEETLTVEYATDPLAQYRAAYEADGRGLKGVDEPRLYATDHASPQPFLPAFADVEWRPAQRLAPYRPRRPRREGGRQERLVVPEPDAATG